jgi:hypothetical protein
MGYWIYLEDDNGDPVSVDRFSEGGVVEMGGSTEAMISVTTNYTIHYAPLYGSNLRGLLDGKKAVDTISDLDHGVTVLFPENYQGEDYWESTPANAGRIVMILLNWAKQHPNATWRVSG